MEASAHHPPETHGVGSSLPAVRNRRERLASWVVPQSPTCSPDRWRPPRSPRRSAHRRATTRPPTSVRCAGRTASGVVEGGRRASWSPICSRCAASRSSSARRTDRQHRDPAAGLLHRAAHLRQRRLPAGSSESCVSDIGFYVLAIFSYERFNGLLAGRRPRIEEADGGTVPAVEAA